MMQTTKFFVLALVVLFMIVGSVDTIQAQSNIQTYTPSKLLDKGQWDIKWFNNFYTQTREADGEGKSSVVPRSNFFTSSLEVFTGVSVNNRLNVGILGELRSNTLGGKDALSVFSFSDDDSYARSGLSSFAPAIKVQPFKNIGNFSLQSAFHIPIIEDESNDKNVYLDQTAYTWQNRFFYDYSFSGNWQIFAELNTEYHFGNDKSFANNTFVLGPGVFLSYFPSGKSTLLALVQHYQRVGDFTQDFTALGIGAKYQLTDVLNIEAIYSKFVRGNNNGLGETFNLGLRALF